MSEMVERVAETIWGDSSGRQLAAAECGHLARAAIAAMREPTPAMIEAGLRTWLSKGGNIVELWRAMIDKALTA